MPFPKQNSTNPEIHRHYAISVKKAWTNPGTLSYRAKRIDALPVKFRYGNYV